MRQTAENQAQVGLELGRVGGLGVELGERVGDAVLLEVVADRHLAAEAVAAEGDGHLAGVVGRGLDEDGDLEVGETEGVGEAALFAEVGQGDDDAVDLGGVLLEEGGALLGVLVGLDGAVGGLLGAEDDRLDAGRFERGDHLEPAAGREVAGKEAAVAYDYTHCHLLAHNSPVSGLLVKVVAHCRWSARPVHAGSSPILDVALVKRSVSGAGSGRKRIGVEGSAEGEDCAPPQGWMERLEPGQRISLAGGVRNSGRGR